MPQITKTVDKTSVSGSEDFIYTIDAAYSGLTTPAQEGKIIEFFPSKITYILPPEGSQIQSITETPVEGGTQVSFHLGSVNSGTSLSFTIACQFGPGRVENDSFTNSAELVADDVVVAQGTAPTVELTLNEWYRLTKSAEDYYVHAGDEIIYTLSLINHEDPGFTITDVVITDTLPPELTPVTTYTPVGNDIPSTEYSDPTANGLTGSWNDNTLTFHLPKYNGFIYKITYKVKVSEDLTPGQICKNTATWTMNGSIRNDATGVISIYDPDDAGFYLMKSGARTTTIGAPMDYELYNSNHGNVTLPNYELEDVIPSEVSITGFRLQASTGLDDYSIYMALESDPNVYIPIATNIANGSYPYTDLTPFIPPDDRLEKIKLTAQNLFVYNSEHYLYLHGVCNSTAIVGGSFTNTAVATSGSITYTSKLETLVNGASELNMKKEFVPVQPAYYPLEEFSVILTGSTRITIAIDPILADLMPTGLRYVEDSEYFLYAQESNGIIYDSRDPDFPVPMPTRELIENFADTGNTLIRWSFSDFILPTGCSLKIMFKAFVEINPPSSFINKSYMGMPGDQVYYAPNQIVDTMDIDGDGFTDSDVIAYTELDGIILTTSEFSLKKLVKGQNDLEYSSSGITTQGGTIDYRLQITNNQTINLTDLEIIDILPYIGDTGVMLTYQERGSQFHVYATSMITAQIINIIGDPVDPNPDIVIEYSTSNDPKRFDNLGDSIGTGDWSLTPPSDITTLRSIKVTTGPEVILQPYDRLIIDFRTKAPADTPIEKIAYNSYAVRANKVTSSGTEPLLPTEPNKVEVTIIENASGTIGGFVWIDTNKNGLYDQG